MTPEITDRDEQPYVAIRRSVTIGNFPEVADRMPEVFGWLRQRGIGPSGPPFFRYVVIDMERELQIEAGVPGAELVPGDDTVPAGALPAGRDAPATHLGHPHGVLRGAPAPLARGETQDLR